MVRVLACTLLALAWAPTGARADLRADWAACQQSSLAEFSRTRQVRNRPDDQYCYGLGYAFGWFEGGKRPDLAAQWYATAANAGHAAAQTALGYAHEKGYGVTRDTAAALSWYRRAADAGNADGMFNVGRLLDQGIGATMDKAAARQWFERAAALGSSDAATRLEALGKLESLSANLAPAAKPTDAVDPLAAYLDGLESLRTGRFAAAGRSLDAALGVAGSDPRFILARGVAATLDGDFADGARYFERYERLGGPGREATLWRHAALGMGGNAFPGGGPVAPRSLQGGFEPADLQCQSGGFSVPGHLAQGSSSDYPTDYASHVIYDMGWGYVKARCSGDLPPAGALADAFARAGRWFAYRNLVRPELAGAHRAKARELFGAGRFDDALLYAGFARKAFPDDAATIHLVGASLLALGRPLSARRELTIALTIDTRLAGAYLDRARAAAAMGDADRASADLDIAAAIDENAATPVRQALAPRLDAAPEGEPGALIDELLAAAAEGGAAESLMEKATRLQRAQLAARTRFDEIYQDRLRVLETDVALFPDDPDRLVALATWIGDEAYLRGESVEPRRPLVPYRWQLSEAYELEIALAHLDRALGMDANHVGALLTKALVLARLDREDEAESLADRAIALAPDDPEALSRYAYYKGRRANMLNAQAAALRSTDCSSSSHTETRYDGVWEVTTTTCYPPTNAELALADALDREADLLRDRSRAAMNEAIAVTRGTYMGYLLEADAARWSNRPGDAIDPLKLAIALDPVEPRAQETLARLYAETGQDDLAVEQRMVANTFVQTTAAPLLHRAWQRIQRTDWSGATADLSRALQLDPGDARGAAYLGAVLELQDKPAEAARYYRVALAMEEARLALDEVTPRQPPSSRDAGDFGLALAMRERLADLAVERGDLDASLLLLTTVADHQARFSAGWQAVEMFTAMLPGTRGASDSPPSPRNGASLVAAAYNSAGRLYQVLGRMDDAVAAFRAAVALGPAIGRPKIGSTDGGTNYAGEADASAGDARVALAGELLRAGDLDGAEAALSGIGYGQLTNAGRAEANVVDDNLRKLLDRRRTADPHAGMSATQLAQEQAYEDDALRERERQLRQVFESRIEVLRAQGMEEHARAEERNLQRQLASLAGTTAQATGGRRDDADQRLLETLRERVAALRGQDRHALARVLERVMSCDGLPGAMLLAPGVTPASGLIGTWDVAPAPEWRYMPGAGRLELRGDGTFHFQPLSPGAAARDGAWGVLHGQLLMADVSCGVENWYLMDAGNRRLVLTAPDAVKFTARRAGGG